MSKGRFCHVGIAFSDSGVWHYSDMQGSGLILFNGTGPHSDNIIAVPTRGALVLPWVIKRVGERYGWLDLLVIATRKWLPRTLGGNPNGMVCSEMVATLLDELRICEIPDRQLTPTELYTLLASAGNAEYA
jgi:hypothetical protein